MTLVSLDRMIQNMCFTSFCLRTQLRVQFRIRAETCGKVKDEFSFSIPAVISFTFTGIFCLDLHLPFLNSFLIIYNQEIIKVRE